MKHSFAIGIHVYVLFYSMLPKTVTLVMSLTLISRPRKGHGPRVTAHGRTGPTDPQRYRVSCEPSNTLAQRGDVACLPFCSTFTNINTFTDSKIYTRPRAKVAAGGGVSRRLLKYPGETGGPVWGGGGGTVGGRPRRQSCPTCCRSGVGVRKREDGRMTASFLA